MRASLALLWLSLWWCGCSDGRAPRVDFGHRGPGRTQVAHFGGDAINAEELEQRFGEMSPYARARYQTVEQKREYLDGLVRFELLAQEAVRRGMANDPEVVESTKKVMVQRLLNQELEQNGASGITEEELRAEYERHLPDYQRPEMVRLSHIFFAAPVAEVKVRAEKLAQAKGALEKARAPGAADFGAFGNLAQQLSEEPRSRPLQGDLRFLSREELSGQYGPEVLAASDELKAVGEVLPRVVETERGFHVLKLRARQPAMSLSFSDVKVQLERKVGFERRTARLERLLEELKRRADYRVDVETLARVPVDLKAPARQPSGPSPGFLGPPANGLPPPAVASPAPAR